MLVISCELQVVASIGANTTTFKLPKYAIQVDPAVNIW